MDLKHVFAFQVFQAEPTAEAPATIAAPAKKPSSGEGFSLPSIGINTGTLALPGASFFSPWAHRAMPLLLLLNHNMSCDFMHSPTTVRLSKNRVLTGPLCILR